MSSLAKQRLAIERKGWRKDHPHGFVAKPATARDGSTNFLVWEAKVPGKAARCGRTACTPCGGVHGGLPEQAPEGVLPGRVLPPNVYLSGKVCLSILEDKAWKPSITVKQILVGVQELLDNPNNAGRAGRRVQALQATRTGVRQARARRSGQVLGGPRLARTRGNRGGGAGARGRIVIML